MKGVGTDLVDIDRFRNVLARTPKIVERLFCEGELSYAQRAGDPVPRLAARFAAKEAALKSLGYGIGAMKFQDIEIVRQSSGRPTLRLHGKAAAKAKSQGVGEFKISLSHTNHLAQAIVIALPS